MASQGPLPISLTPEQIQQLDAYRNQMAAIATEIERAERAGIDVTDLKAQFVRVENLRSGLLKEYGPPPSRGKRRAVG
jgi:hypothetical protein